MQKTYQVVLSSEAEKNIEESFLWIAATNEPAAEPWYAGRIDAIKTLSKPPLRHPLSPETRLGLVDFEIRQLLHGKSHWKNRVLYAIEKDRVAIAHVHMAHASTSDRKRRRTGEFVRSDDPEPQGASAIPMDLWSIESI